MIDEIIKELENKKLSIFPSYPSLDTALADMDDLIPKEDKNQFLKAMYRYHNTCIDEAIRIIKES